MIETERLIIRDWQEKDRQPLRAMTADPQVMRHFPAPMSVAEADAMFDQLCIYARDHGFTFWAVERKEDGEFIGLCGVKPMTIPWPQADDIEIGWTLRAQFHGCGYAREAAAATLAHGLTLAPRVVAMTTPCNRRSWGLMIRLGMMRAPDLDFNHPALPGSPLEHHIVYVKSSI